MSARAAATSGRRRRVTVQVPLGHPDAADVHRDGRRSPRAGPRARTRWSRRRCRRPGTAGPPYRPPRPATPRSPLTPGRAAAASSVVAPVNDSRASSSPLRTSGSTPSTSRTPATKSAAFAASRVALVATIRTADAPRGRHDLRVGPQRPQRPGQRRRGEPPGGVHPCPSRTISIRRSTSVSVRTRRVHVGHEQPQRVRAAVDRRHRTVSGVRVAALNWALTGPRNRRRARVPPGADRLRRLPPQRVCPRHGKLVRDQRVQALDPVGHPARALRAGRQRVDPARAGRLVPPGQVVAVRRQVGPAQRGDHPRAARCISRIAPAASSLLTAATARGQVR